MSGLPFAEGRYDVFADDDDVIGLCVAKTWPSGYCIIRVDPVFMDAHDEFEVAQFLAYCMSNHATIIEEQ